MLSKAENKQLFELLQKTSQEEKQGIVLFLKQVIRFEKEHPFMVTKAEAPNG